MKGKINKLENKVAALDSKANSLKTQSVKDTLDEVGKLPSRSIQEYNSKKYNENKADVKKQQSNGSN
jgi:hypothetical protein